MGIVELIREHLIEEAYEKGREKGRQEAREEARQEILPTVVKAMLGVGMSEAQVLNALNIDHETLRRCLE